MNFQYTVGYTDSIENFGFDSYKSGPRLVIPITPPLKKINGL